MEEQVSMLRFAGYIVFFALRDVFPVSLYGRDLRERARSFGISLRSCVSTLLNITTLTILVLTTTLVAGLQVGTVSWLRDYVESNPLARTVEVSSTFGTRTAVIDKKTLEELRHLEIDGGRDAVTAAHGWNDVTFWFFTASGAKDETLTHGRTVDPGDPLLAEIECRWDGEGFTSDGVGQAIVSEALLAALGYGKETALPRQIRLDYFEEAAPLEIVGVCKQTPAGEFLITETFNRQLEDRQWDPVPQILGLYWGPVEPGPALDSVLAELAPYLGGRRIAATVEIVWRAGTQRWLAFRRQEPWSDSQWRQIFLPVVEEQLSGVAAGAAPELFEPLTSRLPARATLESQFTRASLYVAELRLVPAVADALAVNGFRVTSNSRELALLFLQISSLGRGILLAVILVVGGLCAVSLGLSFLQSIQRKTAEIAILKAFGTSNRSVLAVYLIEAGVLWAISTVLGLAMVGLAAGPLERRLLDILRLRGELPMVGETSLVMLPPSLLLAVASGALLLCGAATLLAGLLAVRLQPAQALSLHR